MLPSIWNEGHNNANLEKNKISLPLVNFTYSF